MRWEGDIITEAQQAPLAPLAQALLAPTDSPVADAHTPAITQLPGTALSARAVQARRPRAWRAGGAARSAWMARSTAR